MTLLCSIRIPDVPLVDPIFSLWDSNNCLRRLGSVSLARARIRFGYRDCARPSFMSQYGLSPGPYFMSPNRWLQPEIPAASLGDSASPAAQRPGARARGTQHQWFHLAVTASTVARRPAAGWSQPAKPAAYAASLAERQLAAGRLWLAMSAT